VAETTWRAWAAVLSVALGTFLLVTSEFLPIGLLTQMASSLGVSEGIAGLSITIPGLVAAVAAPGLTVVVGRTDRRLLLLGLTVLICLSNLIVAMAPHLSVLLIGRILLGIAVGGFWAFAVAAGRRLVHERSGARATALISAGISIGTVIGVPAGAQIGELFGWREAFVASAVFGVVVLVTQFIYMPSLPMKLAINLRHMLGLFSIPKARIGLLVTLLIMAGQFAGYTYLEPFLRQIPGVDQTSLTSMLFTYGVSGFVGTFLGEAAASKGIRRAFVGAGVLLGGTVLLGGFFAQGIASAFLLASVWGLAFGAIPVCMQIWMYHCAPDAYEGGAALFVGVAQIALAIGSFMGGVVVDSSGVGSALILGGVLCLASAIVLAFFAREGGATSGLSSTNQR
jgi:predicted MFS family arabinose efflux permease